MPFIFSIPLGLSVLHMHETMIKIVCWLSFVFKFYVVFYIHTENILRITRERKKKRKRMGLDNGLFHFDPFATFVFLFSIPVHSLIFSVFYSLSFVDIYYYFMLILCVEWALDTVRVLVLMDLCSFSSRF